MSTPTVAGLVVAVAAIILSVALGAPDIMGWGVLVAVTGWAVFAGRDLVRSFRRRNAVWREQRRSNARGDGVSARSAQAGTDRRAPFVLRSVVERDELRAEPVAQWVDLGLAPLGGDNLLHIDGVLDRRLVHKPVRGRVCQRSELLGVWTALKLLTVIADLLTDFRVRLAVALTGPKLGADREVRVDFSERPKDPRLDADDKVRLRDLIYRRAESAAFNRCCRVPRTGRALFVLTLVAAIRGTRSR